MTVQNSDTIFRSYLYKREFILTCDNELIHWITYADNTRPRLVCWRHRLKEYQYFFEYKKRKLNLGLHALPENAVELEDDLL